MRMIDADELLNALPVIKEDKQVSLYGVVADFMVMIFAMPTIDAVPVVRCRDCSWGQKDDIGVMHCHKYHCHKKENDFCSYGEKKEDRHE